MSLFNFGSTTSCSQSFRKEILYVTFVGTAVPHDRLRALQSHLLIDKASLPCRIHPEISDSISPPTMGKRLNWFERSHYSLCTGQASRVRASDGKSMPVFDLGRVMLTLTRIHGPAHEKLATLL